jgi:type I restriction enzyme S subunit
VRKGYKNTEIGIIPNDWQLSKLGDIADVKTGPFGSTLHEKDYVEDGTPIITVEHLGERGVVHDDLPMVSDFDRKRLTSYSLQRNDMVFSRVGSVDRNSMISELESGWLFSGRLLRIRFNQKNINPSYVSYYFHQESTKQRVRTVAVGQTMASLNTLILKGIAVVFPPTLHEQTAIATALSDADALITSLEKLITKKRNIKRGATLQLLTGKKQLPGFSGKWEEKKLGEIVDKFVNGGTPSTSNEEYWKGHIPWITGADILNQKVAEIRRFITNDAVKNSATNVIEKGNLLLVSRTGVGKLSIAPIDVAISQDFTGVFVKKDQISAEYLYRYLDFNSLILQSQNQGTSIKGITRETLASISINLPPIEQQTAIAQVLNDMDAEIESLERKLEKYKLLKQGMMQELLTGKIRLN